MPSRPACGAAPVVQDNAFRGRLFTCPGKRGVVGRFFVIGCGAGRHGRPIVRQHRSRGPRRQEPASGSRESSDVARSRRKAPRSRVSVVVVRRLLRLRYAPRTLPRPGPRWPANKSPATGCPTLRLKTKGQRQPKKRAQIPPRSSREARTDPPALLGARGSGRKAATKTGTHQRRECVKDVSASHKQKRQESKAAAAGAAAATKASTRLCGAATTTNVALIVAKREERRYDDDMASLTLNSTLTVLGASVSGPQPWDTEYNNVYTLTTLGGPVNIFTATDGAPETVDLINSGVEGEYFLGFLGGPNEWVAIGPYPVTYDELVAGYYRQVTTGSSIAEVYMQLYPAAPTKVEPPTVRQSLSRMPSGKQQLLQYARGIQNAIASPELGAAITQFNAALSVSTRPGTRTAVTVAITQEEEVKLRTTLRAVLLPLAPGLGETPTRLEPGVVNIPGLAIQQNEITFGRPTGAPRPKIGKTFLEVQGWDLDDEEEVLFSLEVTDFPVRLPIEQEWQGLRIGIRARWVTVTGGRYEFGPWSPDQFINL